MSVYKNFLFPIIRRIDAEFAHDLTLKGLETVQGRAAGRAMLRRIAGRVPRHPVDFCGITLPNVIGVAAGLDKDVRIAPALAMLGFGHVEVGTLTPRPQEGNPAPRVFRFPENHAVINRMGFPNAGARAVLPRLRRFAESQRACLLGVSLGKQKETPLENAAGDYIAVMRAVYRWADYLAVNISSPNTPGLRELQGTQYLRGLLEELARENKQLAQRFATMRRPLLVKIAPDLSTQELDEILDVLLATGVDGIIATNTTLTRPESLRGPHRNETGGLSGVPLAARSNEVIRAISSRVGSRLPIIGVGGVLTGDDVLAKLDAGASLVQVYTGFVYEGPEMPGRILRDIDTALTAAQNRHTICLNSDGHV